MQGQGDFIKLTKGWESYMFKTLYPRLLKAFPDTKRMTQKKVASFLVDQDWIEEVQRYTWRSARASGLKMGYTEFKESLLNQKMYDGKIVNSWKNSYVSEMSRKMTRRIKKKTLTLNQRLTKLDTTDSVKYVGELFATIENPPKGLTKQMRVLQRDWETLTDAQKTKKLASFKNVIKNDITTKQYNAVVRDSVDKVNNFQGKRIAQDQLQRANNEVLEVKSDVLKDGKRPKAVLVGFWSLSPTHKSHYYKGQDPCEKHAKNDDGYGKGSHVGKIPYPVRDSHVGCKCSMKLKVMELKN